MRKLEDFSQLAPLRIFLEKEGRDRYLDVSEKLMI